MSTFRIQLSDEVLGDLRQRLLRTRFASSSTVSEELLRRRRDTRFPRPTGPGWEAGVDPEYLKSLVSHWAHDFDWRAAEVRPNGYPQFIEHGMHFVHLRRVGRDRLSC